MVYNLANTIDEMTQRATEKGIKLIMQVTNGC
ncbi:hypothetical protein HVS_02180 [Acetivibrio saccincola]|jgi:hypothetical protein|uniref:Uncharacterized protein n=1 Tax=Acetivibrio saccincola TaxID=1677857 RepID=A0A2K9EES8_9FIRM|nr:hypothetical protein HVS_02180 [Acetivibrio saccincola]